MRRVLVFAFLLAAAASAQQDVLTANYGNARTNADPNETILTPSAVASGSFHQLFTLSVDGQIYAQPLYRQNVNIGGATHNVVFVATMHNTVYAFDADIPGAPLWSVNLGPSVPVSNYVSDIGVYTDISPENGILGTPVIDPATGTLYAVAATWENGSFVYGLHALDTASGAEKFGAPTTISAQVTGIGDNSVNGVVALDPSQHIQRPGLLLVNGAVYISFGSHGDAAPYHGWILAYSAMTVQNQLAVYNATPNGSGGAFWQSGRGLTADDAGNIYAVSSNGDTDDTANFSDSVLKLDPAKLSVTDWFSPSNVQMLNDGDEDLGSAGALLIPGTNYLVTGGKAGSIYLLDKTALGHSSANDSQILQRIDTGDFGFFNFALWNRADGPILYTHTSDLNVTAYRMSGSQFSTTPTAQSLTGFGVPFQGMTISSNGGQPGTGILWATAATSWPLPSDGVIHAYNADDLSELWNSSMLATDFPGQFVKFANPTVANGKVYVPTGSYQLAVYGIGGNGGGVLPAVTGVVNAASYASGPMAPGEILALFGQNLGPQTLVTGLFDSNGQMLTELDGTQVLIDGLPAPLLYTSSGAVAAIVPYEIAGEDQVSLQVSWNGQLSPALSLPAAAAAPGIFSADASGSGPGAILNSDYSLNSPSNPATAGSIAILYATGGGQTNPPATDGAITTAAAPLAASDIEVSVGGQPATVLYAGNAGGEVAGVTQINLQLPSGVTGTVPVVVTVAGQSSQQTVTVSAQ
jgi:uncharacterized protein (TIGR03437 family)